MHKSLDLGMLAIFLHDMQNTQSSPLNKHQFNLKPIIVITSGLQFGAILVSWMNPWGFVCSYKLLQIYICSNSLESVFIILTDFCCKEWLVVIK